MLTQYVWHWGTSRKRSLLRCADGSGLVNSCNMLVFQLMMADAYKLQPQREQLNGSRSSHPINLTNENVHFQRATINSQSDVSLLEWSRGVCEWNLHIKLDLQPATADPHRLPFLPPYPVPLTYCGCQNGAYIYTKIQTWRINKVCFITIVSGWEISWFKLHI